MASSLNTENEDIVNGDKLDHGKFLKERQSPNHSRDRIDQNYQEKFSQNSQNSADASDLSRSQKESKLDDFKRRHRRRRGKRKQIASDFRADTAKILEGFLQKQLAQQDIQTSSPEYQRIVEVSVTENTTPSGDSSSYLASSSNILRENSIPYADESDTELKKSESLPHDSFVELQSVKAPTGLPIHHGKSRSAPYTQEADDWRQRPSRRLGAFQPTPPPPPGTPHTPSENSSNGSASLLHPVPYTGKPTDSSVPCSSDSLGTFNSLERRHSPPNKPEQPSAQDTLNLPSPPHSHSRSVTPITDGEASYGSPTKQSYGKQDKKKKSGWSSSSDTDSAGNPHNHGRKKKSMFKKAQHRLQNFFRQKKNKANNQDEMDFDDEDDGYEGSVDEKITKPKKKHKKYSKEMHEPMDVADNYVPYDDRKVLEERHIKTNKRIHQTHSGEDGRTVIRSEEVSETVDIVDRKEKKHTEKHWKMKESSGQDSSIFGKLRRLTSSEKGKKHNIKESKSAHFGRDEADFPEDSSKYSRAISVPGRPQHSRPTQLGLDETDDANLKMYTNRRGFEFSNVDSKEVGPGVRQTSATQVICREEQEKDIRRHSSHLDIVDHSGHMIERLYFDADGNELPKNKSFSFLQEEDVHERVIDDNGRRRVIRDASHSEHMEVAEDSDGGAKKGLEEMTEVEKEDLYGKIASRLAFIGDNLMSEREDSRSASASPRSKMTDDQKSSPEQEFTKTTLTPLEIELRDELRKVGDDMDAKLDSNAKKHAVHLTGLVTYNHFKNVVQESVGQEQGWDQVAAVFHITKSAMKMAGASGALALQIKEMSLKYIEDRFANWIYRQGGWESMLSDADSDTDS